MNDPEGRRQAINAAVAISHGSSQAKGGAGATLPRVGTGDGSHWEIFVECGESEVRA